jgi:TonB family protein
MLLALALLGVFVLLFVYYRWFGNILPGASNEASVSTSDTAAQKPRHVSPVRSRRASSRHHAQAIVRPADQAQLTLVPAITQASIRSPLAVEVMSGGGQHQVIGTRDDSIYLNEHEKTPVAPDPVDANAGYSTGEVKAAEQTSASSGFVQPASPPAAAVDPLMAKQPVMEGAVLLLARIDKDGNIQSLQAISGPETLFAAAREAVKQWHFKPYYNSGQAVETEAEITVKFAISAR